MATTPNIGNSPGTATVPSTEGFATTLPPTWNLRDLHEHLGGIPLERIRLTPPPGTATVEDVERLRCAEDRLCELIDGVLVEKTVGALESELAVCLAVFIKNVAKQHDLGIVLGADGFLRLTDQQVRGPDVSFIGWNKLPGRTRPRDPVPQLASDLAVEVISPSNTPREMERKLKDYFDAGVQLVWYVDPQTRSATVYTAADKGQQLSEADQLDGGSVLPGFKLLLRDLFAEVGM